MSQQKQKNHRSTGRVDYLTGKGTTRFYALPLAATKVQITRLAKISFNTPGQILDQLVDHAGKTDFVPAPHL